MIIRKYSDELEEQYEQLLFDSPVSMFNHSLKYRRFLKSILSDSEDHYLCCIEGKKLITALPLFIRNGPYGRVINSLPFFGSHGGFVYRHEATREHCALLLKELDSLIRRHDTLSCTIIESPFETRKDLYKHFDRNFSDNRIGQITPLPSQDTKTPTDEQLFGLYHQKTRNMVRKGLKSGFEIAHDGSMETLQALHSIHNQNIERLGGQAKQWHAFESIQKIFNYDTDYRVYTARKDGKIVSALLIFYFKNTVEYFTPAILEGYRNEQPLSALIYNAMLDAVVEKEMQFWNWGGTWLSQAGVYQFKSRWGTENYPYRYHIKVPVEPEKLKQAKMSDMLSCYTNFYTIPFDCLSRD
jgi:lipid II:glycine glycyltransferase (peptidoglycan interpeptide bridge formation enzyme)